MTARDEFRAGWPVLVGSILAIGTGVSGVLLYTTGLFVPALEREIGLTRTQFGFGMLMATIALSIANPIVGWAIDRYGVRRPVVAGLLALSAGFAALSVAVTSVASYIAIQTALAFFAAASGPTAYTKTVSAWFREHRGLALGITMTGIGLAAALLPPIVARTIAGEGWQAGYRLLSGIALFGLLPLLLVVRLPEATTTAASVRAGIDVGAAIRTRAFWTMISAFAFMALGFAGLLSHFVPMLIDSGVDPLNAAGLAGLIGLAVIVSRVVIGALVDRIFAPWVAIGVCALSIAGCAVFLMAGASGAPITAIALGIAMGGEVDLIGFLVARFFGLAAFGRIYGIFYAAFILASGFSPLWIGILRDRTGSYDASLIGAMALPAVAAVLFALVPRYPAAAND